ncbi:glycosyltransferase family 4 protein [Bacteroides acidifaciens]|uniref:Glycosyltransferase family 1 protein n=1 Tax=Bacteroides acidifaciens TaxID=85831 RepID=A0A3L7YZ51_9BACE|nr:glycosyltransferase family 4 protein [Bacteroides acidifaciens]MCR1999852.1 glycosyltransferase family 4 protein [Bacteroides acidifaciens]RLT80091.1 glycosyltransferase family 1 protein [Bacteroides acidifaciens]
MKKALVLASVASMIDQFNMPNIRLMIELGYKVDVACNFVEGSTCSDEKVAALKCTLAKMGVECHQVDFARNVLKVGQNLRAYRQTRHLVKENDYDLIHSHSPIGGLLSRIAARDMRGKGTKVIYTAHGFHFFKGASLQNWLIFYPIEKFSSRWTDVLVTITYEDYKLAQEKMYAKEVVYVPGVGINTKAFNPAADYAEVRAAKRKELGIGDGDILMLSVGELNRNKNHEVVLHAMASLGDKRLKYVIAGRGVLKEHLEQLATELGINDQLQLLGFRTDVRELFKAADVFAHPSYREGLSVAVMEAMASGLPVLCSRIRGNTDLIDEGEGGFMFSPAKSDEVTIALSKIMVAKDLKAGGAYNIEKAKSLDVGAVMEIMRELYNPVNVL